MNILDFISSFGCKRLASAKTVTGDNNPCNALVYQLRELTDKLPDGKMHLEVSGSQVAIVIGWNGKEAPSPLTPVSADMTAGSNMVMMMKTPDGTPFYSVLQSDDILGATNNIELLTTTNDDKVLKTTNDDRVLKTTNDDRVLKTTNDTNDTNFSNSEDNSCNPCNSLLSKENNSLLSKENSQQKLIRSVKAFLDKHYSLRFNLLTLQTEVAKLDEDDDNGHHIYYNVDQRMINSMTEDAIEEGIACWNQDILRSVNSSKVKTYHPFREYMESLPKWDGIDRVTPLAQQLNHDPLIVKSFHRWMLAVTAQWMGFGNENYANSVAPLLISEKQGWGKSTFCRSIMPKELSRYFTDSYDLNATSAAEQKLTTFGLINLDEFDKLSSRKMAMLKNLMQMPTTNIRRPYKQAYEQLPRIASFIGTSNRKDLLFDKTGSRRFICIELERPLNSSPSPTLSQGDGAALSLLYSQLKAELLAGERYWFSKEEEAEIQKHNKKYYHTSPAEEIFATMFRQPESPNDHVLELSAANIYERMRKAHPKAMQSISSTAFARLMPTLAAVEHTRYGNVYRVVEKS